MPLLVALAPLIGDHRPQRVREGDVFEANEYVAQRLVLQGLALDAHLVMPSLRREAAARDSALEDTFVRAAEALAENQVAKRRKR